MGRLQNSWSLAKASWNVLKSDKQLVWIPVLSFLASIVAFAVLGGLIWATIGKTHGLNSTGASTTQYHVNVATVVLGICLYVVAAFIATYFLAVLCASANARFQGGDTSIGAAMAVANTRLHRILGWSILAATVSIIVRALEDRGMLGRIVGSLLNAAWTVVTFLAVPIIVFEDLGPINALKRSGGLFKQTWGENLAAQVGFGFLGLAAVLPAAAVIALGAATHTGVVVAFTVVIGVAWIAVCIAVISALNGIYRTALYRYAVDGRVPAAFSDQGVDLSHAFAPKSKARSGGFGGFGGFGGPSGFSGGGGFSQN